MPRGNPSRATERNRIRVRAWWARNKNKPHVKRAQYNRHLIYKYGITLQQKEEMLAAQGGVCGNPGCERTVPGGKGTWLVDHDHNTNEVRGVICHGCNVALGQVEDNIDRLLGLVSYLRGERRVGHAAGDVRPADSCV